MDNSSFRFSWKQRAASFRYAGKGIRTLFLTAHNARIHAVAALMVILAGWILNLSVMEWVSIIICIGMVISAEALNSAVEALSDRISLEKHPLIGQAKDLAAAAVLILAVAAAIVGLLIFIPKIIIVFFK